MLKEIRFNFITFNILHVFGVLWWVSEGSKSATLNSQIIVNLSEKETRHLQIYKAYTVQHLWNLNLDDA